MSAIAERIAERFSGLDRAHGQYTIAGGPNGSGKVKGKAVTVPKPPTPELWAQHLSGKYGLGIIPIRDDGTCSWGALDLDVPGINHVELEEKILELGLPLVVAKSKSLGAHLFLFMQEPTPATLVRSKLLEWSIVLGHSGCEVFPKQTSLASEKDFGNFLNMPYYNGDTRVGVFGGNEISVEQFLDIADGAAVTPEQLEKIHVAAEDYSDAPPCLQQLVLEGFPEGTRNDGLFNMGVYFRQKYADDWESRVYDFNHAAMDPPLYPPEVMGVIKSLKRKTYFYKCEQPPICGLCNKELCRTRAFGVGSGGANMNVVLGTLTKRESDPPIWFLEVDQRRIELSTDELLTHRLFKRRVAEVLTKNVPYMKQDAWDVTITELMDNAIIEDDVPEDAGIEGQFHLLVDEFLARHLKADSREDLLNGLPWLDDKNRVNFRSTDLMSFLRRNQFNKYEPAQIYSKLRDSGAGQRQLNIKGTNLRVWYVPYNEEKFQSEEFSIPDTGGIEY